MTFTEYFIMLSGNHPGHVPFCEFNDLIIRFYLPKASFYTITISSLTIPLTIFAKLSMLYV